jgi:hypothetical protein
MNFDFFWCNFTFSLKWRSSEVDVLMAKFGSRCLRWEFTEIMLAIHYLKMRDYFVKIKHIYSQLTSNYTIVRLNTKNKKE